jgi:plastocyanin
MLAGAALTAALMTVLMTVLMTACSASSGTLHVSGTGAPKAEQASASATAQPAADGVQQIVIDTLDDGHFRPDVVFAKAGELRVTITNPSVIPQDFEVPTLNVHSETIFAGKSTTLTFAVTAGVYPFDCHFQEHEGMTGQLIVS